MLARAFGGHSEFPFECLVEDGGQESVKIGGGFGLQTLELADLPQHGS